MNSPTRRCESLCDTGKKCKNKISGSEEMCWKHKRDTQKSAKVPKLKKKLGFLEPKLDWESLIKLPNEALFVVLLNTDPEQINALCRTHKKIAKICREKNFQLKYQEKYGEPQLLLIKGELKPISHSHPYEDGSFIYSFDIYTYTDNDGNKIEFEFEERNLTEIAFGSKNKKVFIFIHKRPNSEWGILFRKKSKFGNPITDEDIENDRYYQRMEKWLRMSPEEFFNLIKDKTSESRSKKGKFHDMPKLNFK